MTLKLRTEAKTETLTNENSAFDDSGYQETSFVIKYIPLTRTQEQAIVNKYTKYSRRQQRDKVDTAAVDIERFCRTVKSWEGICDYKGQEVPCTDENKKVIAELEPIFSGLVLVAIYGKGFLNESSEPDKPTKEEAEIKN